MDKTINTHIKKTAPSIQSVTRFAMRDALRPIKRRWGQKKDESPELIQEREKQAIRQAVILANKEKSVYQLPDFRQMQEEKVGSHLSGISDKIFEMLVCKHLGEAAMKALRSRYINLRTYVHIVSYLNELAKAHLLRFPTWYTQPGIQGV